MEARKLAMITGFYSNSNYDDDKGTRNKAISQLEDQFKEAIAELYEPTIKEEKDPIKGNPFFDAMNVPGEEIDQNPYAKGRKYTGQPWIPTDLEEDI